MNRAIERALETDRLVDITTTGARTGRQHRIEIAFHNLDGALYISGLPGKRDWYANLLAHPEFTFHLKQSTHADLAARAFPIEDEAARRKLLTRIVAKWKRQNELEAFVKSSPLVRVELGENQTQS
jgi:deazaflavin-dependent oxidoreductase (nitroreductase family)